MNSNTERKNLIINIVIIILAAILSVLAAGIDVGKTTYVAAAGPEASAWTADGNKAEPLIRGSQVHETGSTSKGLSEVEYEGQTYYVSPDNLTEDEDSIILEKEVYVRTPVTIYKSARGSGIEGFAPKGSRLDVLGHSPVRSDGSVKRYKVKYGQSTGYVYGKYMAYDQKSADKNCNDQGAYDQAKDSRYGIELYGGDARDLDYYPVEFHPIEGNEFCDYARAMYLHAGAALDDRYFKLAKKSGVNAVVINIDGGTLAYKSPVAKEMCPSAYKDAHYSLEKYQQAVAKYNDAGIYTIGRIVAFNDPHYASDHKDSCIVYNGSPASWVSAYDRGIWEYKIEMAKEAVDLMGFREIQFDYVRFPESTYEMSASGRADFRNKYHESKSQAIQNFCFYAADQIHEAGAYLSIDVFGECSNGYVTAYGQYWPAISNVVDAISSMPYTDHFGTTDTWSQPYSIMRSWADRTASMQNHLPTPAVARTWITGYNTPSWAPNVTYDYSKLHDQVKALEDAGMDGGFIPWNSQCDYGKYQQYSKIWNK